MVKIHASVMKFVSSILVEQPIVHMWHCGVREFLAQREVPQGDLTLQNFAHGSERW